MYSLKDILKSLKVLLVSKKEKITKQETDILELFFHDIIISTSIQKSLEKFSDKHPDVVIVDVDLKEENGIIFCKNIRKINPSIPIIILSALKDENYLFDAIRLHVIDYIVRPIQIEDFIFALNQTAKHIVNHGNITIKLSNGFIYNYKEKIIIQNETTQIKLTKNEFRLLEFMLANKTRTLSKKEIEDYLWANEVITSSAFKSLFSRLRMKIGKECIKNNFGIGYQLT